MKKIKVCILGGQGKMGKILVKEIKNYKNLSLKELVDQKENLKGKMPILKLNNDSFKKIDLIIDFSKPDATLKALQNAIKFRKRILIGTTGFNSYQEKKIKNYSRKIAIFKSGNMSFGVNLLEYVLKIISKKIPNDYQIGISDNHHKAKIDFPSGTALMLANAIAKGKGKNFNKFKGKIFLNKRGNIQNNKVNFFVTRKGKTIGKHSVFYNNKIENIELKHTAYSRKLFAHGALSAAQWICKKKKGLFNMQDMFNL